MNQFMVVKPESSKTLACLCVSSTGNIWGRRWGEIQVKTQQSLQGRLWKWSFSPLPRVYPPSAGPQGVSSMLPWEILTAETSGRAALQPQIQKHKQAGNAELPFPPRRHVPHSTHCIMKYTFLKPSYYIEVFLFIHTEKSNAFKNFLFGAFSLLSSTRFSFFSPLYPQCSVPGIQ